MPRGADKVPQITWVFWTIKIAATTLGETGGDAVSMSLHVGYLASTAIFAVLFAVAVLAQCAARRFHPALYWTVIVATTTTGTTMADFADRSLGLGYVGGSLILACCLVATLVAWWMARGSISAAHITSTGDEIFYWAVILFSNTLGTALGDFAADAQRGGLGLGYERGALLFACGLIVLAGLWALTRKRAGANAGVLIFWAAFILSRPLGATLGDMLTKPRASGGLEIGRIESSAAIALFIMIAVAVLPSRASFRTNNAGEAQ